MLNSFLDKLYIAVWVALFATLAFASGDSSAFAAPLFFGAIVVDAPILSGMRTAFKAIFKKAFEGAPISKIMQLAMTVPSTNKGNTYAWMKAMTGLRKWLGERIINSISATGFLLLNEDFEETVAVSRNDIEDDDLGVYDNIMQILAINAKNHPSELLLELLQAGTATLGWDTVEYFDTVHPNGKEADYSNLLTLALTADNYQTARETMMSYVNEHGKSLGVVPTHLLVPPQLEKTALEIVKARTIVSGGAAVDNVLYKSTEVVVVPELSNEPTTWYLFDLSKPLKPLILQTRKSPVFVAHDKVDDEAVFMRKEFIYGVDYRGAVGYGLPHLALWSKP